MIETQENRTEVVEAAIEDVNETNLPEGVTEEPRNDEEMHLKHIKAEPRAVMAYLQVSDDQGELLGDKVLEQKIIQFCDSYKTIKKNGIKEPAQLLQEAKQLTTAYALQINMVESSLGGTVTKYRIRQGMIFLIMKKLAKLSGEKWTDWFSKNFNIREFRSVQDYMKLAKIPNSIRYAVFGKERLLQIIRQLDDRNMDDPIGDYLEENGVDFHPDEEADPKEIRIQADIAISRKRLTEEGVQQVPADKVEAFVRTGNEIEKRHARELKLIQDTGGNLTVYMDRLIASGGKFEPLQTAQRKSEGFKKTLDRFLSLAADALSDPEYLGQVDLDLCKQLKDRLVELENKIASITN